MTDNELNELEKIKDLKFAEGVRGIEIYSYYFCANEGYGNMAVYHSVEGVMEYLEQGNCKIIDLEVELNENGEITYLYGVFK